jgi:replicative superfamily II helicase
MAISTELRKALESTTLTFEELRAFEAGLMLLSQEEQDEFLALISQDPELVYPLYINFKAKLHAASHGDGSWEDVIEQELQELEEFMKKRRVGNEIV